MTEDEIVGWHHRPDGHRFRQTPGVSDGQGGLACCGSWGRKKSDMTEASLYSQWIGRVAEDPSSCASVQFSSVAQSCPTLCNPMDCSMPGLPVLHQLPEFTQTHVHCVSDAIQQSHSLSSPSPPALNLSQHQGLFKGVSSSHQVAKVLEFQLQHQSFQ